MGDAPIGFWAGSTADPERTAVIDPDGRRWTAGEIHAGANRVVGALRAAGLSEGDVVATLSNNRAELIQILMAVMQGGWHYVPLNTHLTAEEIAYILEDSGARALFADPRCAPAAVEAVERAGLATEGRISLGPMAGFSELDEVTAPHSSDPPAGRLTGQFLQYTSGTTGRPKAVLRSLPRVDPEAWLAVLAPHIERFGIVAGGDAVHLVTSPMYHLAPLSFGYLSAQLQHTVVLMERWDAVDALNLIERHRVTDTHVVPTQLHRLMQLPDDVRHRFDVSSLCQVIHAAAPCPVDLKQRVMAWLGPVVYEYYGASEGGGTLARPEEWLEHPGTVGRPWPGAGIRILDDDGNDVPAGTVGTVYMKLAMPFEYKGDPQKTADGRRGEWFTVGDVGDVDGDGFLYLRDRKVDMIIRGGVNVYPAEIEAALLSHPDVGDAAVFGIPDDDLGEQVMAVVEPRDDVGASDALAAVLDEHCRARLAPYKCPTRLEFIDALPRDPNGKLYKRRLRQPFWAERDRSI